MDPREDTRWKEIRSHIATDGVHQKDQLNPAVDTKGECFKRHSLHAVELSQ